MNKTISINLGGSVFNIEEDAYNVLRTYLENIKSNFSGDPAALEIMSDIEARIAEIFHDKNSDKKNAVVLEDVNQMISIMGQPEDYKMDDDKSGSAQNESFTSATTRNRRRRIYRDNDDAILGGVCAGLSHYVGWDPIVVRLLVVIICFVSFGTGVFGYILFWALTPAAITTAEKLQMRGEPVNVENIGKFVNEEARSAADRLGKAGRGAAQHLRTGSTDFFRGLLRAIAVVFGAFIMFLGFAMLAGLFSMAAFSEFNVFGFDSTNWDTLNTLIFGDTGTFWVLVIGTIFAIGAPAIALIYSGIKIITRTPRRIRGLALSLLSLFIIGTIMCIYGGIKTGKQFSRHAEVMNSVVLNDVQSDTLKLEVIPDDVFIGRSSRHNEFHDMIKIADDKIYYGEDIEVKFEPSHNDKFKIEVQRYSQGRNMEQAGTLARNIEYAHRSSGDSLFVGSYFTTPKTDMYRAQEVDVIIYIPVGKYVHMGKNVNMLTWDADEDKVMRMSDDGLESEEGSDNHESRHEKIEISVHPDIRVTDDSVVIRSGGVEIKSRRD